MSNIKSYDKNLYNNIKCKFNEFFNIINLQKEEIDMIEKIHSIDDINEKYIQKELHQAFKNKYNLNNFCKILKYIQIKKEINFNDYIINFWSSPFPDGNGDFIHISNMYKIFTRLNIYKVNFILLIKNILNLINEIDITIDPCFIKFKDLTNIIDTRNGITIFSFIKSENELILVDDFNKLKLNYESKYKDVIFILENIYNIVNINDIITIFTYTKYNNFEYISSTIDNLCDINFNLLINNEDKKIINITFLVIDTIIKPYNCLNFLYTNEAGVVVFLENQERNKKNSYISPGFSNYNLGLYIPNDIYIDIHLSRKLINNHLITNDKKLLIEYHLVYMGQVKNNEARNILNKLIIFIKILILKYHNEKINRNIILCCNNELNKLINENKIILLELMSENDLCIKIVNNIISMNYSSTKLNIDIYFYNKLSRNDFLIALKESENIVLMTGDQSFHEAILFKKRIFYDCPSHKLGAYEFFISLYDKYSGTSYLGNLKRFINFMGNNKIDNISINDIKNMYMFLNGATKYDEFVDFIKNFYDFEKNIISILYLYIHKIISFDLNNVEILIDIVKEKYPEINYRIDNKYKYKYIKYKKKYVKNLI